MTCEHPIMVQSKRFIENIVFLFARIRPIWLRKKWFSFIHTFHFLSKRIYRIVTQIRLPVFLAGGVGKTTNEPLHILFIGIDHTPHFLFHKLFKNDPVLQKERKIWIWNCSKISQTYNSNVEGILVSVDRFFHRFLHKKEWFVLPHWVGMWFDSSKDLKVICDDLSRSAKRDVKIVKKQEFSFILTKDIEKIRSFYDEMYLPTMSANVDKDEVYIADFLFFLLRYYKGYELMMINYGGKAIAGVFFLQKNDTILLEYAGVYQADPSLIKQGAFSAIYYFAIELAKQRKVKKIDFGGVRPFNDDGLFQYKKKWGLSVEPYDIVSDIAGITMLKSSQQLTQFLIDNAFIGMDKKGTFVWYVFSETNLKDADKRDLEEQLKISGIEKVNFVKVKH